jgi:hypothetical protein
MSADTASRSARIMAWLVVALVALFIVLGAAWYGFSPPVRARAWHDLFERYGGPMSFRFFLQPTMAAIAATVDGIKDARIGRSPYLWTVLSRPSERGGRLREALFSTARIILLGLGMDAIYQYRVLKTFYPDEALLIALMLAVVPYFLVRGPVTRIAYKWIQRSHRNATAQSRE